MHSATSPDHVLELGGEECRKAGSSFCVGRSWGCVLSLSCCALNIAGDDDPTRLYIAGDVDLLLACGGDVPGSTELPLSTSGDMMTSWAESPSHSNVNDGERTLMF